MKKVAAKRQEQYKNSTQMDVSTIRFTQKSINDTFSNGTPIKWTIYMLKTKHILPIEIPLIRVGFYNGYFKSIDNRRLYCYKQSNIKTIPVIVMKQITKEFKCKDQSPNNGTSVKIIHDPKSPSNEIVTAYNPLTGKSRTWTVKNIIAEETKTKSPSINKTFYCDTCQIQMSFNDKSAHLRGQKHHSKQNKSNQNEIFYCDICQTKTYTLKDKTSHLNGKKHKSNLAKYEANKQAPSKKSTSGNKTFYCDLCKTSMSYTNKSEHLDGKRHKSNVLNSAEKSAQSPSIKPAISKKHNHRALKPQKNNDKITLKDKTKEIQELNAKLNKEKLKCKSLAMTNKKLSIQINQMTKTINELRNKISTTNYTKPVLQSISANTIDDEKKAIPETDEVRIWMQKTVKLPQYFEVLINNGFDDLDIIEDINNEDMIDIGIHKIGHRKKILKHAMKLGDNTNVSNEKTQQHVQNINRFDDIDKFHDELAHDIVQDFDKAFNIAYQSVYTQKHE